MMAEPTPQEQNNIKPSAPALDPSKEHHEQIHDILMNQDEITWRSIILDLMKEMNLHISGKVLLCAALLLRVKSSRLVGDDMMEFDRLLASGESDDLYSDEDFVEGELGNLGMKLDKDKMRLIPKTPQPRKRKVSVYDLIDALAIALNVRRRRILNQIQVKEGPRMPEKTMDISQLMDGLYEDVIGYLSSEQTDRIAFSDLAPGDSKQDKIYTFVPLLHLTNARKVDLDQKKHFGEIWVSLAKQKAAAKKAALDKKNKEEEKKQEELKKRQEKKEAKKSKEEQLSPAA
jgi:chromatin segregation and condensation protein Rec8/ScpA/Scc1 (kleisin family)